MNVSSVAQSWLRQREAPHGALVVADSEIAPRGRIGQHWKTIDGMSAAVVVRPSLGAAAEDLLWLAALVATCDAYRAQGHHVEAWWPDSLILNDRQVGLVTVDTQLGPGTVVSSVLALQLDVLATVPSQSDRLALLVSLMVALERVFKEPLEDLVGRFDGVSGFHGRPIIARLKPRGSVIGISAGVDELGQLMLEASSGGLRGVAVDQVVSVELDLR